MTLLVCAELEKWIAENRYTDDFGNHYLPSPDKLLDEIRKGTFTAQADGGLVANADGLLPCPLGCDRGEIEVFFPKKNTIEFKCTCCGLKYTGKHLRMTREELKQAMTKKWNTRPSHSGWQPMLTAPYDGTEIELLIRHRTWYQVKEDERDQWQAAVKAKFIMHNGGGWTWAGMTGNILGWRNIQPSPEVKP